MHLQRLSWMAVFLPLGFLIFVGTLQHFVLMPLLPSPLSYLVILIILAVGVVLFSNRIFSILAKMASDVTQRNRELSTLNTVASTVAVSLEASDVMTAVLDKVLELLDMEVGETCLWDEDSKGVVCVVHRGVFAEEFAEVSKFRLGEDFLGLVIETGKSIVTYDLGRNDRYLRESVKKRGSRSWRVCH